MAEDKSNKESQATETETEEVEAITIESVDDIAAHVEALAQDGASGQVARNFLAKRGFRSMAPLLKTNPHVLATMAGCISYALAEQSADGEEGAAEALALSIEYAENATTLKANMVKLRSYCAVALSVGYSSEIDMEGEIDMDDLNIHQMAKVVGAFLNAQKTTKVDKEFKEFKVWNDDLIGQPA